MGVTEQMEQCNTSYEYTFNNNRNMLLLREGVEITSIKVIYFRLVFYCLLFVS